MTSTVLAGLFLFVFGGASAWFLATRFPSARFLRVGYALMAVSGALFLVWAIWHALLLGIVAASTLAIGAIVGIVGAVRREMRMS